MRFLTVSGPLSSGENRCGKRGCGVPAGCCAEKPRVRSSVMMLISLKTGPAGRLVAPAAGLCTGGPPVPPTRAKRRLTCLAHGGIGRVAVAGHDQRVAHVPPNQGLVSDLELGPVAVLLVHQQLELRPHRDSVTDGRAD